MAEQNIRANHDSAWKDILDVYFQEFTDFLKNVIIPF